MWPLEWDGPRTITKVHDDEAEALDHLKGLQSMLADHEPRPCGKHVWDVKLEMRETGEWTAASGKVGGDAHG